jgi:hypothetical protein
MKTCPTCGQAIAPMNPHTLVSVHAYSGDQSQVEFMMPYYLHHEAPVIVMSPSDSPITKVEAAPTVICRQGGMRAYIGEPSLLRQREHMRMLLEFPFDYFLMNDADSVCVAPKIPKYIYDNPEVLWSNVVSDMMHQRLLSYRLPRLAFQPPYFISRRNIEKILKFAPRVRVDRQTPFIDWAMMAWAVAAGIPYKGFHPVASCPTRNYQPGVDHMSSLIRQHGAVMLHSIKDKNVLEHMVEQHRLHKEDQLPK